MTKQYGAIPYLRQKGELRVVLITSASGYWIFPKGRHEKALGKKKTAELEALEEAGVKGEIRRGRSYRAKVVIKSGERVRLTLYALKTRELLDRWEEEHRRERAVLSIEDAVKRMTSEELIRCLRAFERDFAR